MRIARLAFLLFVVALPCLAHPGIGIVMDRQGNVYYTDLARVWRIDPAGRKTVAVPGVHTHELALDAQGNLYGQHLWYEGDATKKWGYYAWKRTPSGRVEKVIPTREGWFLADYSFVRDASGTMYWAEPAPHVVFRRRTPDGKISDVAACPDCRNVRWLAATAEGTILFTDAGDLRTLGTNGSFRTLVKGMQKAEEAQLLMGIWTDARRNVFVADYGARRVFRVAPDGKVATAARSHFPWAPSGGTFAPDGALWLLENTIVNTVRVRRIAADGKERIF